MSIIKRNKYLIIFTLCSLFFSRYSSADDGLNFPSLKQQIYTNFSIFLTDSLFDGEISFTDELINGELFLTKILRPPDFFNLAALTVIIKNDNLESTVIFTTKGEPIEVKIFAAVSDEHLSGFGIIENGANSATFDLYTRTNEKNTFDLNLEIKIENLILNGDIGQLYSGFQFLIESMNIWTIKLGFNDLITKITSDLTLHYLGLDLECSASLNFYSSIHSGFKGGIDTHHGKIWSYGNSFNIEYAAFDFTDGSLDASGKFEKKAYTYKQGVGTIRIPFKIKSNYSGIFPDKVETSFISEPEMIHDDIVNILVKGTPQSKKINGTASYSLEEKVTMAMDDYNPENIHKFTERQVGKIFAVDRVVIEGESFSLDSPYYADKSITDRLRLQLRGTVGGTSSQTISFNYRLFDNISIVSETNQKGNTGIDLRYLIKFK